MAVPSLHIRALRTHFVADGVPLPAVDGVSLRVDRGQIVALVGESGCGKSVTALSIMRLLPQPPARILGGAVLFRESGDEEPVDLLTLGERALQRLRGNRLAMIFQDPLNSLNPVYTVGEQIVEVVQEHRGIRGRAAKAVAVDALREVGLPMPEERVDDYPHQLSGGMQQRVMIAMALSCRPALLIADEPTTALDVTVQLQILELLRSLRDRLDMSVLIITHDLGVVAEIADYVYVMYAGRIVEHAPVADLFAEPLHPYTQALLRCVPRIDGPIDEPDGLVEVIPGSVPDLARLPSGCPFHPRCRLSADLAAEPGRETREVHAEVGTNLLRRCVERYDAEPSGRPELEETRPHHFAACWDAGVPIVAGGR